MRFEKTVYDNDDNETTSIVEASSLESALAAAKEELSNDDRFCQCHGETNEEALTIEGDSIYFSPGDGGEYLVVTLEQIE